MSAYGFDRSKFMNDVTSEMLKTPVAKETLGQAAKDIGNWDVRGLVKTLDSGVKEQMDNEFRKLYSSLPSTFLKESMVRFVIFTNMLVKKGLQKYGITVDDPNFEERLPESAMNMGNLIIVLNKALEDPEVKQSFDQFNQTLGKLLEEFMKTATFVIEEFKPALMQQGNELVQYAGEMGQASGEALVKGGMSALGTLPVIGQAVNVARLNAAMGPLQAKGIKSINMASNLLDKFIKVQQNIEPKVLNAALPALQAQQQGKQLLDNLQKHTSKLNTVNNQV